MVCSCSAKMGIRSLTGKNKDAKCSDSCDQPAQDGSTTDGSEVGETTASGTDTDGGGSTAGQDGGGGEVPPIKRTAQVTLSLPEYVGPNSDAASTVTLQGTANSSANDDQVSVSVSLKHPNGNCLNTNATAFDQACPVWHKATGSVDWTYAVAKAVLGSSAVYNVTVRNDLLPLSDGVSVEKAGSFVWDSTKPQVTSFTLNGGAVTAAKTMGIVSFQGSDGQSPLTHYCIRSTTAATAPTPTDGCFVPISDENIGAVSAKNVSSGQFSARIGFVTSTYHMFIWVKDAAGNVSQISNSGNGTSGTDVNNVLLQPTPAPTITDVLATSVAAPSTPPSGSDLIVSAGGTVYIKWKATDDKAFPATPMTLFYSTDDSTYQEIATNLVNGSNAGCTIDDPGTAADDAATGCYTWASGAPTSSYFRIRVGAVDSDGFKSVSSSVPLNLSTFSVVAGNTDPGTNNSASSAMFVNYIANRSDYSGADPGSFVVTSNGTVYFRDIYRGILEVKPDDGLQRLFIPTTGTSSGDGGNASAATLKAPARVALDFEQNLLIFDYDRIRKVDFSTSPAKISTIIGGGSSTSTEDPLDLAMDHAGDSFSNYQGDRLLQPLPNGDIWVFSNKPNTNQASLRIYHKATGKISSLTATGTGNGYFPADNITNMKKTSYAIEYDPGTSNVTTLLTTVSHANVGSTFFPFSNLDPTTGVAVGPHPPFWKKADNVSLYPYGAVFVPSMNGELYSFSAFQEGVLKRFNKADNTWDTIAGEAKVGTCADGSAAIGCSIAPQAFFIGIGGSVYFMELGRLRTIDDDGNIQTIFGQGYEFGDNSAATNARFGNIRGIQTADNGDIAVIDSVSMRLRQVTAADGKIDTVAGNGAMSSAVYPDTTNPAAGQPIVGTRAWTAIAMNRATGDVFVPMGGSVFHLTKTTGIWDNYLLLGGGSTSYHLADGISNVSMSYQPSLLGFSGSELGLYSYRWNGTQFVDYMYKTYDATTKVQSHLAGISGTFVGLCDPTANIDTSACSVTSVFSSVWDSVGNRWIISAADKIVAMPAGGKVTLLATLPRAADNFAYYASAAPARSWAFYCNNSKIYRYSLVTSTEEELLSGLPGFKCVGPQIDYDATRNRLLVPFVQSQSGLQAVGAFQISDTP